MGETEIKPAFTLVWNMVTGSQGAYKNIKCTKRVRILEKPSSHLLPECGLSCFLNWFQQWPKRRCKYRR